MQTGFCILPELWRENERQLQKPRVSVLCCRGRPPSEERQVFHWFRLVIYLLNLANLECQLDIKLKMISACFAPLKKMAVASDIMFVLFLKFHHFRNNTVRVIQQNIRWNCKCSHYTSTHLHRKGNRNSFEMQRSKMTFLDCATKVWKRKLEETVVITLRVGGGLVMLWPQQERRQAGCTITGKSWGMGEGGA